MIILRRGRIAAASAIAVAMGCGGPGPVPALDGRADRQQCADADTGTHCFHVTVTNRGAAEATGECWVAAIRNFRKELARSDSVHFTDLGPDEVVEGEVSITLGARARQASPTFPVHCDPGGSG